jgi:hypothetical protein
MNNNSNQILPSYMAFIPADVRYNKNIEPSAKLLYGELTSLTSLYGYCWASNQYFAELYQVDVRTISRWLKSLVDEKFITIEHPGGSFSSDRKIYLFQNIFTKDKNVLPPMTKMSDDSIYRKLQEEQQQQEVVAAVFYSCLNSKDIPHSDKLWISEKYTEPEVLEAIDFVENPTFKISTSYAQALKWALKTKPEKNKSKEEQIQENKEFSKHIEENAICPENVRVESFEKFIEFTILGANCPSFCYDYSKFSHEAFKEKVKEKCKELKIMKKI